MKNKFKTNKKTVKDKEFLELEIIKIQDEIDLLDGCETKKIKELVNKRDIYQWKLKEILFNNL